MRQSGEDIIQSAIVQPLSLSDAGTQATLFCLTVSKSASEWPVFGKIDAYLPLLADLSVKRHLPTSRRWDFRCLWADCADTFGPLPPFKQANTLNMSKNPHNFSPACYKLVCKADWFQTAAGWPSLTHIFSSQHLAVFYPMIDWLRATQTIVFRRITFRTGGMRALQRRCHFPPH